MSDRDSEFLRYYQRHRIDDQKGYYLDKSGWHQRRANALIIAAGAVMFLSSAASWAVSQGSTSALWLVLAIALPGISGAIVAVRSLYEFERNHSRFLSTYYDLRYAAVEMQPPDGLTAEELREATARYVAEIENLLSRENRQWIKLMATFDKSRQSEGDRS